MGTPVPGAAADADKAPICLDAPALRQPMAKLQQSTIVMAAQLLAIESAIASAIELASFEVLIRYNLILGSLSWSSRCCTSIPYDTFKLASICGLHEDYRQLLPWSI